MPNIELLQKTMQHILDHPEQHNQRTWVEQTECGTAACFAGWACILSGKNLDELDASLSYDALSRDHIGVVAQKLLDITIDEVNVLFAAHNTVPMLELMVKDLSNGDRLKFSMAYDDRYRDYIVDTIVQ